MKTLKIIKKMTTGKHPHGVASPKSQDVLYIASETEGTVTKLDTVKDEIIEVYGGWGTEPQESDITPDGHFLYQPSYAGYWNVFDTQKKEIVAYIHTLGIGHNTLIDPQGHFAYLFPIKGGPGHWRRPSLGLPRTQPNEVTVVDITKNHQVVGTIPVGDGPRPPIMTADGKRIYMDVDRLMGFLVIDTDARKVIGKATMNLTADEQASVPNGHAHGIAIGNGGKEVWTNATGLDTTFVFDVTVNPPKQIARIPVGGGPYWIVPSQDGMTMFVACPASDEMVVVGRRDQESENALQIPCRRSSGADDRSGRPGPHAVTSGDIASGYRMLRRTFSVVVSRSSVSAGERGLNSRRRRPGLRRLPSRSAFRWTQSRYRGIPCRLSAKASRLRVPRHRAGGSSSKECSFRKQTADNSSGLSALCVICPHEQCAVALVTDPERLAKMSGNTSGRPLFECACHFSKFDASEEGAWVSGVAYRGLFRFRVGAVSDGTVEINEIEEEALSVV